MSRLILVFSQATGIKLAWPPIPEKQDIKNVVDRLVAIKKHVNGPITLSKGAELILEQM